MADKKYGNRIPFEDIESFSSWRLPSLGEGSNVVPSVKRGANNPTKNRTPVASESNTEESIEEITEPVTIKPLTAQQLQEITEEAEREGRERGYQEGYQQGASAGEGKGLKLGEHKAYEETKAELEEKMQHLNNLVKALHEPVEQQDSALEHQLVEMAIQFAKHLINKELSVDPSSLFKLVERAVASLPAGSDHLRLYLHPDDLELVQEAFANHGHQWRFFTDDTLSRGGCRVESEQSLVDFSIEKRLTQMLQEVEQTVPTASEEDDNNKLDGQPAAPESDDNSL